MLGQLEPLFQGISVLFASTAFATQSSPASIAAEADAVKRRRATSAPAADIPNAARIPGSI
jgi:hypothetical protein